MELAIVMLGDGVQQNLRQMSRFDNVLAHHRVVGIQDAVFHVNDALIGTRIRLFYDG